MTAEFPTSSPWGGCSRTCLMNYNEVRKIDNECAKTLCARDYKGFGTGFDVQNGIIEIE